MKPYTLLFCYTVLLVLGYYAYISCKRPEVLRAQLSWYARIYDGWYPRQAQALRANSHLWTMRVAHMVMFMIVLPLTGMVVLGYPSTEWPAVDTLGPLFTLLLQAALLALLYRYLCRHKVGRCVYYVMFVILGLCFGLGFALLNGAATSEQYALSLVACGALGLAAADVSMAYVSL